MSEKLLTYLKDGAEVPAGTAGAAVYETSPIYPETGLYAGGMTKGSCDYRCAAFIDGGKLAEGYCVPEALQGGTITGNAVSGGKIVSENAHFNGIMVNNTDFALSNVTMTAKGSGGNDFKGYGAGFAAYGKTKATVENYVFDGAGALRHGVFVGGTKAEDALEVTVKNSFVRADGSKFEQQCEGMSSCPWMLGISPDGHARATMCDGYSTVNYESDILLSDGWGVLSVDDTGDTVDWGTYSIHLNVKDTVVDVTDAATKTPSCYATYSIGGCLNRFYGCTIGNASGSELYGKLKAALPAAGVDYSYGTVKYGLTYAAVVANEHASAGWYDGTTVTAKYGVMYHKTSNVRYVPGASDDTSAQFPACGETQVEDSTFLTYGAAFLIKACTPAITVRNSRFKSEKRVIVQLMTCDDPGMGSPAFSECITGEAVAKDPKYDPYNYNRKDQTFFRKFNVRNFIADPQVSFADCNRKNGSALEGNFFNAIGVETEGEGMKWWGQNLVLSFDNCDIFGACSSAAALHDAYSYFTAKAENPYGAVAVNADGYEIAGAWEEVKQKMPMMDMGDMPGGPGGPEMGGMPGGPGGPEMGGMPGGPGGPEMGGMPGGPGGPEMGGMPGGPGGPGGPGTGGPGGAPAKPTYQFQPQYDEAGKLIVIGKEKLTPDTGIIASQDATLLGNLNNIPAPTVNNGVWVKLTNGSVWTPVGVSYLTRLEVAEGCTITGKVTVDGAEVVPQAGKVYTGAIVVTG